MDEMKTLLPMQFSKALPENSSVYESPEDCYISFQPAGYSQMNNSGYSRQDDYKKLFAKKADNYAVYLIPDPNNKYDNNAIRVLVRTDNNLEYDLGFVPRVANLYFLSVLNLLKIGVVDEVKTEVHGKYITAQVKFYYDKGINAKVKARSLQRFVFEE